jgi:hypothetical protein
VPVVETWLQVDATAIGKLMDRPPRLKNMLPASQKGLRYCQLDLESILALPVDQCSLASENDIAPFSDGHTKNIGKILRVLKRIGSRIRK